MQFQKQNLETFQRRIALLVGARLKMDSKVEKAVAIQDQIRAKVKMWNGTKEIRKWREKRAS